MRDPLPVDELEAVADMEVGEALRRTRLYYGKSLEDIEKALRIRACQIDAIERGDLAALPGRVYAIGFVRSYAEYLDLDGGKVVQLFKTQYMGAQNNNAALSFPVPASETKTPALWLVVFALIFASGFIVYWNNRHQPDRAIVEQIETMPERIEAHINTAIKPNIVNDASDTLLTTVNGTVEQQQSPIENMGGDDAHQGGIILKILGDSWVEIKNAEGGVLVSKVLENGDEYFVPDNPGLSMSLGNAANVEILVKGRPLMPLGNDGEVRRNIPLNTNYLKTLDFRVDAVPKTSDEDAAQSPGDVEDMTSSSP
tara:strand:- start:29411 stop:30346 length:936 start_codon:yes stop_codon:yes gene_type:complete